MEAKKRIENDPAIGEVLFHDDDCLIKVNNKIEPLNMKHFLVFIVVPFEKSEENATKLSRFHLSLRSCRKWTG